MKTLKVMALVTTVSTLVGCSHATLDKEDCIRGDWYNLGVKDGTNGKTAGELNLHKEACAEYSIIPDEKHYLAGRDEGLKDYCKLDNAVTSGLNGQLYQGVCPKEVDEAFRKQNLAAYNLYLMYRSSYYNSFYNNWGYPYYGGWGFYPSFGFGYYGGRHPHFRPFGRFNFYGGWGW